MSTGGSTALGLANPKTESVLLWWLLLDKNDE